MNYKQTLDDMLEAAAEAAPAHWPALRGAAEIEFKQLSETALELEADFVADIVAAEREPDPAKRTEMERRAKRRIELAFDSLKLAAESIVIEAPPEVKMDAQAAVNAALAVLRGAINTSIGIAML